MSKLEYFLVCNLLLYEIQTMKVYDSKCVVNEQLAQHPPITYTHRSGFRNEISLRKPERWAQKVVGGLVLNLVSIGDMSDGWVGKNLRRTNFPSLPPAHHSTDR
jgi:hypothetical protein